MTDHADWLITLDSSLRAAVVTAEHPRRVEPQLAVPDDGRRPAGSVYERKLDGMRLVVHVDGDRVSLRTRKHEERAGGFPELVEALGATGGRDLVADGEVVAFDGSVTSFSRLQGRIGLNDPRRARLTGIAVHLYLFDLLHLDGHDLRALPLLARKELLRTEVPFTEPVRYTPHHEGDPEVMLAEACSRGWEGLIAKDPRAPYRPGRSPSWRKLKCSRDGEFVIGGWTTPRGSRSGFGALLLGYHEDGRLRYAGKVGTGFGETMLAQLSRRLSELERGDPAFVDAPREAGVHWVEPRLVARVAYTEWTREGRLRHPRFEGLRPDERSDEVTREGR